MPIAERAAHGKAAHANSVIEMADIFAEAQRLHIGPEIGHLLHKLQQRKVAISSGAQKQFKFKSPFIAFISL